jgi:hypothetical protein
MRIRTNSNVPWFACSVPDIQGLPANTFKDYDSSGATLLSFGTKRLCSALDWKKPCCKKPFRDRSALVVWATAIGIAVGVGGQTRWEH